VEERRVRFNLGTIHREEPQLARGDGGVALMRGTQQLRDDDDAHIMRSSATLLKSTTKTYLSNLHTRPRVNNIYIRPFVNTRTMNTLQEKSKIYNAFKKGGPSFGGWQVHISIAQILVTILIKMRRCFQARTMPVQLLVRE
jgi:hypothetical protein